MATDREKVEALASLRDRDKSHLLHKKFKAPKRCSEFKTIVMRELDVDDEVLIACRTDEVVKALGEPTLAMVLKVQGIESQRMAIVAVDDVPVADKYGSKFAAFDQWRRVAKEAVERFYNELNGLKKEDAEDLEKAAAEAEVVEDPTRLMKASGPHREEAATDEP